MSTEAQEFPTVQGKENNTGASLVMFTWIHHVLKQMYMV